MDAGSWMDGGRLFSRLVQCSQCNGFLHEGSLCLASRKNSGRCWKEERQRPVLDPPLGITGRSGGPEGRAGLPSVPGNQHRALG